MNSSATARLEIETFADTEGCRAYLLIDGASGQSMVVDPRLDQVDAIAATAERRGARIVYVMDTHTHADHLSGCHRLSQKTGAVHLAHVSTSTTRRVERVTPPHALVLGDSSVQIIGSSGHTPDSVSFFAGGCLFTGDALFVGGAGRTDFPGGSPSELFDSFRRMETFPDDTVVMPGHVYGTAERSTLGAEKVSNPLFGERNRAALTQRLSGTAQPPDQMMAVLSFNMGKASEPTNVPASEVANLIKSTRRPFLLDVRTPIEFASEHIEGSVNIPLDTLKARLNDIPHGAPVVVICRSGGRATTASPWVAATGHEVKILTGGVRSWMDSNFPVKKGHVALPLDRQVQLTIGVLGLTGCALAFWVNSAFLIIPAFLAAGLTFAGLTGTCGLGMLLAKMPWNHVPGSSASGSACAAPSASACAAPQASACAAPQSKKE